VAVDVFAYLSLPPAPLSCPAPISACLPLLFFAMIPPPLPRAGTRVAEAAAAAAAKEKARAEAADQAAAAAAAADAARKANQDEEKDLAAAAAAAAAAAGAAEEDRHAERVAELKAAVEGRRAAVDEVRICQLVFMGERFRGSATTVLPVVFLLLMLLPLLRSVTLLGGLAGGAVRCGAVEEGGSM